MVRQVVTLFVTGLFAFGCTPSPEKVCDNMEKLSKKKDDDDSKSMKKLEEEMKKLCPKLMGAVKEDSPEAYKCYAKCTGEAKDMDDAKKCEKSCDGMKDAFKKAFEKVMKDEKKKGDDDDDKDKKKKKSDDDDDDKKKKKKDKDD